MQSFRNGSEYRQMTYGRLVLNVEAHAVFTFIAEGHTEEKAGFFAIHEPGDGVVSAVNDRPTRHGLVTGPIRGCKRKQWFKLTKYLLFVLQDYHY